MNKLSFKWVENKAQYQTGEYLYLNRIRVGSYSRNSCRPRNEGDSTKWEGDIFLPSLLDGSKRIFDANADVLKGRLERIVTNWFREVLK